jgi:hypothetical protein
MNQLTSNEEQAGKTQGTVYPTPFLVFGPISSADPVFGLSSHSPGKCAAGLPAPPSLLFPDVLKELD